MRQDVLDLREFYATPLGRAAREMVSRKVTEAWGDARGLDLLALGYATPFLDGLGAEARRAVAAMPAAQGVEVWPAGERNRACLAEESALPFPNALFDRVLAVHALEESDNPLALLQRDLAGAGAVRPGDRGRHRAPRPVGQRREQPVRPRPALQPPPAGAPGARGRAGAGRLDARALRAAARLGRAVGRGLRTGRRAALAAVRRA